ncbi:MAG: tetratricopeptide repeat protein [bacterium]|nr:tetratricopeptide repeat protein [bacterium]
MRKWVLSLFISIVAVSSIPSFADIITLTSGKELFGEIISESNGLVKIMTPTGTFALNTAQIATMTKETITETQLRFGDYYFERKDYYKAVTAYQKAIAADSTSLIAAAKLAQAQQFLKDIWLKSIADRITAIDELVKQGNFKTALEQYAEITTFELDSSWIAQVQNKMADVYVQISMTEPDLNLRIMYVQQALDIYPESASGNYMMGKLLLQLGKLDNAEAYLEKAVKFDPQSAEKRITLGNVYLQRENYFGAAQEFEAAKQISPARFYEIKDELAKSYFKLGEQKYRERDYADAVKWLAKYTATDPAGDWKLYYRAQYQQRAQEIDPNSPKDHYTVALFCIEKSLFEEAIAELQTALNLDPGYALARSKLVEIYDRFATPIFQQGVTFFNQRNYENALERFSLITAKYPLSTLRLSANQYIAQAREALAQQIYERAKTDFSKGLIDKSFYERAYDGFSEIVENYLDYSGWQSAKQMRDRTLTELQRAQLSPEDVRQQKIRELATYIDSMVGPEKATWQRIISLAQFDATDFERNILGLDEPTKKIIRQETARLVYLFNNQLDILSEKLQIRRDRIRTERDRIKRLELTLYILACPGGDYPVWMEIKDYFNGGRAEFDEAKPNFSSFTQQRIQDIGVDEIYRVLNLK